VTEQSAESYAATFDTNVLGSSWRTSAFTYSASASSLRSHQILPGFVASTRDDDTRTFLRESQGGGSSDA
jgi:hypothetical protein